jgi:glycosyltransferase involved in cell wall biosynthesis
MLRQYLFRVTMAGERISVIIPVFNSILALQVCLDSVLAAMNEYGNAELILVDNGSTDGSYEKILADYGTRAQILQVKGVPVSAVRNFGVRAAKGDYLSFIDSDCIVPRDYFHQAIRAFESTDSYATGSMCEIPSAPGWIEQTWHSLHKRDADGYVDYLNSGNFIIRRAAFEGVGGFNEHLVTGEDAELCQRLRVAGFKVYECQAVRAVHLGNPKSLRAFFKRNAWHALGMFGTFNLTTLDKPVLMTVAHLFLTLAGITNLFLRIWSLEIRVLVSLVMLLVVPATTVLYRSAKRRTVYRPLRCLLLYYLYFTARVHGLLKTIGRQLRVRSIHLPKSESL